MDPVKEHECSYGRWVVVRPASWRKLHLALFEADGADALAAVLHADVQPETYDLGVLAKKQESQVIAARIEGAASDWAEPVFSALGAMPEDERHWQFGCDDEEELAELKARVTRIMASAVSALSRWGDAVDAYKVSRWLERELSLNLDMSVLNTVQGCIAAAAPLLDRSVITGDEILASVRKTEAELCERSGIVTTALEIIRESRLFAGSTPR